MEYSPLNDILLEALVGVTAYLLRAMGPVTCIIDDHAQHAVTMKNAQPDVPSKA